MNKLEKAEKKLIEENIRLRGIINDKNQLIKANKFSIN